MSVVGIVPNDFESLLNFLKRYFRISDSIDLGNLPIGLQSILRVSFGDKIDRCVNHDEVDPNGSEKSGHHIENNEDELPIPNEEVRSYVATHPKSVKQLDYH